MDMVFFSYAMERKYRSEKYEMDEKNVFPTIKASADPGSGAQRLGYFYNSVIQNVIKQEIIDTEIKKHASCYTFRYYFATHLIQELLGYKNIAIEMIYLYRISNSCKGAKKIVNF